jgi:hypothetical protein
MGKAKNNPARRHRSRAKQFPENYFGGRKAKPQGPRRGCKPAPFQNRIADGIYHVRAVKNLSFYSSYSWCTG